MDVLFLCRNIEQPGRDLILHFSNFWKIQQYFLWLRTYAGWTSLSLRFPAEDAISAIFQRGRRPVIPVNSCRREAYLHPIVICCALCSPRIKMYSQVLRKRAKMSSRGQDLKRALAVHENKAALEAAGFLVQNEQFFHASPFDLSLT